MTVQARFADAILDPSFPVPSGLSDPAGRAAGQRFDVYRNNVVSGLTGALETAFPVVRRLLGKGNFRILARAFLRAHPPRTPVLILWGNELADFLTTFEPARPLGYLPDVARLEQALRESYHSADADPLDAATLMSLAPDALLTARFEVAPALRVLSSLWPIHAIWRFNREPGAPKPVMAPEDVMITRHGFDPTPVLLPAGGAAFVRSLAAGAPLGEALSTPGVPKDFDLTETIGLLLEGGALTGIGGPK